jgi:NodT family efflux transporter outer membrane factor (OMF) lipoprotein
MNFRRIYKILILFTVLLIASCKSYNTDLSIKKAPLPTAFSKSDDGEAKADLSPRQFFQDSLLVKLIDTVLVNNLDIQMAYQRIEAARAVAKHAKGQQLPKVDLGVTSALRRYGLYTMDGAGNISTFILPGEIVPINLPDYYIGVQSSWELDVWGKLRNQRRWAVSQYLASVEGAHMVITSLVADVASAYYELLALDIELEIIRQTIIKQNEALEVILLQKEAGRANELAVLQFRAQVLSTRFLEREIQQQIVETENLVNFLAGRFPQTIERSKGSLLSGSLMAINQGLPSELLENRPDVRQSAMQVRASGFELKAARAAFLPSVNLIGGLGFQSFRTDLLFLTPTSIAYQAVGSLVAPLVNFNALKARFNGAKANQLEAMYTYQRSILNAFAEVVNLLSRLDNLKEMNEMKEEQVSVLQNAVETSKELYRSAKAGYVEVLLAQQNELQANIELINSVKEEKITQVNLYRALGGGWR